MKTYIIFKQVRRTSLIMFIFFWVISLNTFAQLPDEKMNFVYIVSDNSIYNFDPSKSIEPEVNPYQNKIQLPQGAKSCITPSKNLNSIKPEYTFYTIVNDMYYYHNGLGWVNTGHASGNVFNLNIGSTGTHIYNLSEDGESMYLYNGREDSKLYHKAHSAVDLIMDSEDYGAFVVKATPNNKTSNSILAEGGSYAIINNVLYVTNISAFNDGIANNNCIVFEGGKNEIAKVCKKQ